MKIPPIQIGLEHERVIFDGAKIAHVCDRKQSLLPHDTMACLAETRGPASNNPEQAVQQFLVEQARVDGLFAKEHLTLRHGEFKIPKALAEACYEISDDKKKEEERLHFNEIRGGGLHIHFSCHDIPKLLHPAGVLRWAVSELDRTMGFSITGDSTYRKPTQFEKKPYGFEYRSPFWDGQYGSLMQISARAFNAMQAFVADLCRVAESLTRASDERVI